MCLACVALAGFAPRLYAGMEPSSWDYLPVIDEISFTTANCHYMLRNPIYYGVMRYYGEVYEAKHKPIISKALFDKCQEMLKNKSKPKTKTLKPYVYRGAFRCANCGCFITTETQKGRNYLHCTKRKSPCSEPYVREEEVEKQISLRRT